MQMQKAAENKDSHLARLVNELQEQVETLKKEKEELVNELEIVNSDRDGLETEIDELRAALQAQALKIKENLEETTKAVMENGVVENLQKTVEELNREIGKLKAELQTQEMCIESYRETISRHSRNEAELANKLMCLKSELLGTNRSYQEFRVTKVNSVFNSQVKIVAGANSDGAKVLVLEYKNKRDVYDLGLVESVALHSSRANRFSISVSGECMDFDSEEADHVVKVLNTIMSL